MKRSALLFVVLFPLLSLSCHRRASLTPFDLRCEYVTDPTGLDVSVLRPRLSWRLPGDVPGQRQTAWQVLAASSPGLLDPDHADLWNSGTVVSGQSVQVVYGGRSLRPRQEVWWKVRIWDRHGRVSAWSDAARWETGIHPSRWQAAWIGSPVMPPRKPGGPNPAYHFRKTFSLTSPPRKGRAYISGLGYHELYINGHRVGDHVLSPHQSNYTYRDTGRFPFKEVRHMSYRVYYETYDITPYLQEGRNSVGVLLGNGWFFQHERDEDTIYNYGLPRLIIRLEMAGDEDTLVVVSDTTWRTATGPILHNGIYTGEIYDARRELRGWTMPDYDDRSWPAAVQRAAPLGPLMGQIAPADRRIREIIPVRRERLDDTTWRYDLGEMISGWVRLQVKGPRGLPVTLKFLEEQGPQYGQTDIYILRGDSLETWEPRFTWHAFRRVIVTTPRPPDTLRITGIVVNTDVPVTGRFECSNGLLTRLNDNFIRTQQGNMHGGVTSDCPHRERRGYTGDGQIAARAAIYNFDMAAFYTKWIGDMADGQNRETGFVPYTVPFEGGWGGTPWGSAYIIIPWYMYLYYGDTTIVRRHWQGMVKYIDYLENRLVPPGIVDEQLLGEWVPPQPEQIPKDLVSTAYFHHDLQIMEHLAHVLEKESEADRFRALAHRVKEGFNKQWFHKEEMSYSIGRQGANVFALGFDLVPRRYTGDVFRTLVDHLINDTEGHFDTGMMGTPLLLQVLAKYGRNELAYTLMNQTDYPSFGLEMLKGSTTLWETWDGTLSHSHPMFGSVCEWLYNSLAGIRPDPAAPGFRHILIHPLPVSDLQHVTATHLTPYGPVTSSWRQEGDDLVLEVTVPPNTTAAVSIPATDEGSVTARGVYGQPGVGVHAVGYEKGRMLFETCAGEYRFVSHGAAALLPRSLPTAPVVMPRDTLSWSGDTLRVTMATPHAGAVIRFTLDGTLPDTTSSLYGQPLLITRDTRVKARIFLPDGTAGPVAHRDYTFLRRGIHGLHYAYYAGLWQQVPDFTRLHPSARGTLPALCLDSLPHNKDRFALRLTSWLRVPVTGTYTIYLISNDGSRLYLDGRELIVNDGPHGARERSATTHLTQGIHQLTIGYMQVGGGYYLALEWKGPGRKREKIPPSLFFLDEEQAKKAGK